MLTHALPFCARTRAGAPTRQAQASTSAEPAPCGTEDASSSSCAHQRFTPGDKQMRKYLFAGTATVALLAGISFALAQGAGGGGGAGSPGGGGGAGAGTAGAPTAAAPVRAHAAEQVAAPPLNLDRLAPAAVLRPELASAAAQQVLASVEQVNAAQPNAAPASGHPRRSPVKPAKAPPLVARAPARKRLRRVRRSPMVPGPGQASAVASARVSAVASARASARAQVQASAGVSAQELRRARAAARADAQPISPPSSGRRSVRPCCAAAASTG